MASGDRIKYVIKRPRVAGWISLFTSLSIIILAFFILMNTFVTLDDVRVKKALASIKYQFLGVFQRSENVFSMFESTSISFDLSNGAMGQAGEEALFRLLKDYAEGFESAGDEQARYGMGGRLGITITTRGLVVTMPDSLGFQSGSVELSETGQNVITRLAQILRPFKNDIAIEGHSDDSPTPAPYSSNSELSSFRAMSVLQQLQVAGISNDRMTAAGAGEHRPIASNSTPENRSLNRRVEIIVKHPKMVELLDGSGL